MSALSKTDSLGRRSRLRPSSTGKRVRLTERDWVWLKALHRHGPLASSYLLEFAKSVGTNEKRAKERLTDLFHEASTQHGGSYLKRPAQQFQTIDARYNQLVYDLAPAGVKALKKRGAWSDVSGPSGGPWWHSFMASSVTASIELASRRRNDLTFIPQTAILERAQTKLSAPVTYLDPASQRSVTKSLIPDALFGLEYHTSKGRRYRFFAVEADRATEPIKTGNPNRKSFMRTLAQYEAFIAGGKYREHLKLTAPLLVLFVTTSEARIRSLVKLTRKLSPHVAPALLSQNWQAFSSPPSIPSLNCALLFEPWVRTTGSVSIV